VQPEMPPLLAGTVASPTKKIEGNDKCQNPKHLALGLWT
jgi:hypothetical protein